MRFVVNIVSVYPNNHYNRFSNQYNNGNYHRTAFSYKNIIQTDVFTKTNDNFELNNRKPQRNLSLNFKSRPWEMPSFEIKDSYDAITAYDFLKKGNYLDSSDDDVIADSKLIRENNMKFLDKLHSKEDKKDFINYYKDITGFPDLAKVSKKIEREFIVGIKKSSIGLEGGECIAAGYDETCSVGKRLAFPGSDLDKSFIILNGTGDCTKDAELVEKFKGNLWDNVDQRILSFNHDISFPSVYTKTQVLNNIIDIDYWSGDVPVDKLHLTKLMKDEYVNLEKASEYNIAISKKFPTDKIGSVPTKQDVKNFAYFIESYRDGKLLINTYKSDVLKDKISNYPFYEYSNVAQIQAMKKAINSGKENKSKIKQREHISEKFNNWDTDKQYNFVKALIQYSCEDNNQFDEYFKNDRNVKEAYKPLLNILTRGDRNIYNRVEFTPQDGYLNMKYAEDKDVNLYNGYLYNVLWIDSNDCDAIYQTIRNMDKIRKSEDFKYINKIQCVTPNTHVDGLYPTSHRTVDGKTIWERGV